MALELTYPPCIAILYPSPSISSSSSTNSFLPSFRFHLTSSPHSFIHSLSAACKQQNPLNGNPLQLHSSQTMPNSNSQCDRDKPSLDMASTTTTMAQNEISKLDTCIQWLSIWPTIHSSHAPRCQFHHPWSCE